MVVKIYRDINTDRMIASAKNYGESLATTINLSLNNYINTSIVLKELYLEYHTDFIKDFDKICSRIMKQNPEIGSLYLAPDAIVECAYPEYIAASTLGFEMLKDPDQSEKCLQAIETKQITVAGPHNLVEGGTGFIIRNPIFEDNRFSAFSIIILDWDKFADKLLENITEKQIGYKFAVWKENDNHAITDSNGYIFTNAKTTVSDKVSIKLNVPNDVWIISVEPEEGWQDPSTILFELIMTFFIVIIPVISVYIRQKNNAKNIYVAQHDKLTQLLSRDAFLIRFEKLIRENPQQRFNVIAVDIENFKVTNSIYGTKKCDELLIYLANSFKQKSPYSLCTRFGSDHFIYVMPFKDLQADYRELEIYSTYIMKNNPIDNLSIKFGFYGDVDKSMPATLICDKPLLAAKSILHNYNKNVANYDGPLSSKNEKAQILESSFLKAIKNEEFKVWFQPKFDAISEKLVGAEALVRWIKDDGTMISPAEFIHVFEEDGLIYKLDYYIFEKVCKLLKKWKSEGIELLPVSINISRTTLQRKNVLQDYKHLLNELDLSSEYVPLEITESSAVVNNEIQQLTEELKSSGFKIHMDDFGTGLSSLESLNLLPFDVIKLDKSLVDFIGTPVGEELLKHSIELIKFMNLKTIAEGVESKEQLEFLRNLGCNQIQGYYFSAPMPANEFENFMLSSSENN